MNRDPMSRALPLVRLAFRKLVYRRHLLHRYEVLAGASEAPRRPLDLRVDFVTESNEFDSLLGTNPYLTADDIACFTRQGSTCITVSDETGRVVASTWMTSGDVTVHELARDIPGPDSAHFSSRSYVSDAYRGRALLSHMIHRYTAALDATDVVWGLVYPWNTPSAKSLERIGWRLTGEYWTSWIFGIKRSGRRPVSEPSRDRNRAR